MIWFHWAFNVIVHENYKCNTIFHIKHTWNSFDNKNNNSLLILLLLLLIIIIIIIIISIISIITMQL